MLFFCNDTATTEIYTLSLHDALPICSVMSRVILAKPTSCPVSSRMASMTTLAKNRLPSLRWRQASASRSEEHTSELQSRQYLVCRLLLEKKKCYFNALLL